MKKNNVNVSHCTYCKRHCLLSNPQCKKGKTLAEEIKKADKKRNEDNKLNAGKVSKATGKVSKSADKVSKADKASKTDKKLIADKKPKSNKKLLEIKNPIEALTDKTFQVLEKENEFYFSTSGDKRNAVYNIEKSSTPEEIKLFELFQNCSAVILHKKGHNLNSKMGKDKRVNNILSLISAKGVLTRKELENYSKLTSSDLIEILSKLKKKEYIKWKQAEAGDSQISLTKAGLESVNLHIIERNQDRTEKFSVLNEEEKRDLERILKKLYSEWSQMPNKEQNDLESNP